MLTNKQKEALMFRRDLLLLLTDFDTSQEMLDYKQYLRDLPNNGYEWKQPPEGYKVSRVYQVLTFVHDVLYWFKK